MVKRKETTYWWLFSEKRKAKLWRTEISPILHRNSGDIIRLIHNTLRRKKPNRERALELFSSMIVSALDLNLFDDFVNYILYHSLEDYGGRYKAVVLVDMLRRLTSKY